MLKEEDRKQLLFHAKGLETMHLAPLSNTARMVRVVKVLRWLLRLIAEKGE